MLGLAGCGGGHSGGGAATTTSAAASAAAPTATDCAALDRLVTDLQGADEAGFGFDYVRDQQFIDGFADRAPDAIAGDARRIRDLADRFASAAKSAGVQLNQDPLPDQADQIRGKLHYSSGEQADNDRSLQALDTWRGNTC